MEECKRALAEHDAESDRVQEAVSNERAEAERKLAAAETAWQQRIVEAETRGAAGVKLAEAAKSDYEQLASVLTKNHSDELSRAAEVAQGFVEENQTWRLKFAQAEQKLKAAHDALKQEQKLVADVLATRQATNKELRQVQQAALEKVSTGYGESVHAASDCDRQMDALQRERLTAETKCVAADEALQKQEVSTESDLKATLQMLRRERGLAEMASQGETTGLSQACVEKLCQQVVDLTGNLAEIDTNRLGAWRTLRDVERRCIVQEASQAESELGASDLSRSGTGIVAAPVGSKVLVPAQHASVVSRVAQLEAAQQATQQAASGSSTPWWAATVGTAPRSLNGAFTPSACPLPSATDAMLRNTKITLGDSQRSPSPRVMTGQLLGIDASRHALLNDLGQSRAAASRTPLLSRQVQASSYAPVPSWKIETREERRAWSPVPLIARSSALVVDSTAVPGSPPARVPPSSTPRSYRLCADHASCVPSSASYASAVAVAAPSWLQYDRSRSAGCGGCAVAPRSGNEAPTWQATSAMAEQCWSARIGNQNVSPTRPRRMSRIAAESAAIFQSAVATAQRSSSVTHFASAVQRRENSPLRLR